MKLLKFRWEAQGLGRVREDQIESGCPSHLGGTGTGREEKGLLVS